MSIAENIKQQQQQESTQSLCQAQVIQDQEGQRSNLGNYSRSEEENREETYEQPVRFSRASYSVIFLALL